MLAIYQDWLFHFPIEMMAKKERLICARDGEETGEQMKLLRCGGGGMKWGMEGLCCLPF